MYNLAYGDNAEDNMNMYSIFFFFESHMKIAVIVIIFQ